MSWDRVFISLVMFIGVILTFYDVMSLWVDDLHLVASGRLPEQMIFMFLINMFAAMFLLTTRWLRLHWIRSLTWIATFTIPRFLFTYKIGKLVQKFNKQN